VDAAVSAGQVYSYTVRSHDRAGNLHQPADEVAVRVREEQLMDTQLYLALMLR
jgi:hypothetical protein